MITTELLAVLGFGLCPASLAIGIIGTLFAARQLGVRWPWENGNGRKYNGNGNGHSRNDCPTCGPPVRDVKIAAVATKRQLETLLDEQRKGWHYASSDHDKTPGMVYITFIRWISQDDLQRIW